MKVIDNFLSDQAFEVIQHLLLGPEIDWHFNTTIAGENSDIDNFQFIHTFFDVKHPFLVKPQPPLNSLFTKLSPAALLRCKANLRTRTSSHVLSNFHTDMDFNQRTAIFYVNSNNGYTLFEDGSSVESVANRLVLFHGSKLHCGASCTDQPTRVVLNINYFPNELDPLKF